MAKKITKSVRLDQVHVDILEDLQPYFGNSVAQTEETDGGRVLVCYICDSDDCRVMAYAE